MARTPKLWWRKDRRAWFVTICWARHNLGADWEEASQRFHELMAAPKKPRVGTDSVVALCDAFLDWVEKHRVTDTYRWYQDRLQLYCHHSGRLAGLATAAVSRAAVH